MFDFGRANNEQINAIKKVRGPLRIIAGPGTGKTYTLIQRAGFMIEECGIKPEQIMLVTYTEKAAKELVTRLTGEFSKRSINVNVSDMYIGTFHSICLRILQENIEYTSLKNNYRVLEPFEQVYFVLRNLSKFKECDGYELAMKDALAEIKDPRSRISDPNWYIAERICKVVNTLTEELVDFNALQSDQNDTVSAIGRICQLYSDIFSKNNSMDFSAIQAEAYRLLTENPDILASIREKIKYLMIDEYQDTNYIQEQVILLLAGDEKNICVVGDDDQGLYRFRGATIQNILEFENKFDFDECKTEILATNYRSDSSIVDFYNEWMISTKGKKFSFDWGNFRVDKTIVPHTASVHSCPAVMKIDASVSGRSWHKETLDFIRALVDSGKVTNLNQIAFLFSSVRTASVIALARYLEENGIRVYSPRSNMFFDRLEIKRMLGFLINCFPTFKTKVEDRKIWNERLKNYYSDCLKSANDFLQTPEGEGLREWIAQRQEEHSSLQDNTDYSFTGLLYQMFAYEPFKSILDVDLNSGVFDQRAARNISMLSGFIGNYEAQFNITALAPDTIEKQVDYLFSSFLYRLKASGISEYEDESEYAPSGCVSFLTIHQSKGLEFPVTVVGPLSDIPRDNNDVIHPTIKEKYYRRKPFEPEEDIKYFDFWRKYYTAFSRAQNLLVLTAEERPSDPFSELFAKTSDWRDERSKLSEFTFDEVKDVNLKDSYSFTSHVAVYDECPTRYKFFKALGFTATRASATVFGSLVHQTIEDIHRSVLRNEIHLLTKENIRAWFEANYRSLLKSEHVIMSPSQKEAAYAQIIRYTERQKGRWDRIKEAEVDISLVNPDYILQGKIDLIRGDGETVEIVDFKSEKKPDPAVAGDRIARYRCQMQVYAHLVEQKTGERVSKLHLYYTGDESEEPMLTFECDRGEIEATVREFDDTVRKIKNKDFAHKADNEKSCENCDFRYYCERGKATKERRYFSQKLALTDRAVTWATVTARNKLKHIPSFMRTKRNAGELFLDKFIDDLAKNIVKDHLASLDGVAVKEYDETRRDDYSYRDNYDLIANDFNVEVKGYLEKKSRCTASDIISKRKMFLDNTAADLSVQVVFVPQSPLLADTAKKDETDIPTLVRLFCDQCTVYVVGWIEHSGQNIEKTEIPIAKTCGMPALREFLEQNRGQVKTCEKCGSILELKTNRSNGETFWGCPNYRLHTYRKETK